MNLIQEQVQHSRFGLGIILEQTASTVEVRFDNACGTKKFIYPSAFESFLVLCRPVLKQSMDMELSQIREQNEAERKRQYEADRLREDELRAMIAQHASTKKPAKPKTAKPRKKAEKIS